MKTTISFSLNGKNVSVTSDPDVPLLYILRNELELNGPKFGCGLGQCGACMVLLGNEAVPSCQFPTGQAEGKKIRTLEGLTNPDSTLNRLQQAFMDEQAAQCGFCLNGLVIKTTSLLEKDPSINEDRLKSGLSTNICRCGVHSRVLRAVKRIAL